METELRLVQIGYGPRAGSLTPIERRIIQHRVLADREAANTPETQQPKR